MGHPDPRGAKCLLHETAAFRGSSHSGPLHSSAGPWPLRLLPGTVRLEGRRGLYLGFGRALSSSLAVLAPQYAPLTGKGFDWGWEGGRSHGGLGWVHGCMGLGEGVRSRARKW